jgi:hypothetical protein
MPPQPTVSTGASSELFPKYNSFAFLGSVGVLCHSLNTAGLMPFKLGN